MIAKLITVKRKLVVSLFTLVAVTGAFVFYRTNGRPLKLTVLPAREWEG